MKNFSRGFGTLEIAIAVLLIGLLIAMGIPSFKQYKAHQALQASTEDLRHVILVSEKETLVFNHPVILCPTLDQKTCSTNPNASVLIAFIDSNDDAQLSSPDQIIDVLNLTDVDIAIRYKGFPYPKMHVLSPNNRINSNGTFILSSLQTQESYVLEISKSGIVHAGYPNEKTSRG